MQFSASRSGSLSSSSAESQAGSGTSSEVSSGASSGARSSSGSLSVPSAAVRQAVADMDAPFSVLDLDAVMNNAQDMLARAAGTPIRLASKSVRIPELMKRLLRLEGVEGILSYTLTEALWLASMSESMSESEQDGQAQATQQGQKQTQKQTPFSDILVAYPTANKAALRELADSPYRESITLMVDSVEHLDLIDHTAPNHPELRLCIDIDASLAIGPLHIGARRSPVHSPEAAAELARHILSRPGFRLVGLMAYEGQIAGTTDTSAAISVMKALSVRELAARRRSIVQAVQAVAGDLEFVNGGGTGSIETTRAEEVITEIGAGSGIIAPGLFDHYKGFSPQAAQWFVLPVVRRPAKDIVTVAGGGRIASGAVGKDRLPVVDYPRGLSMSSLEGAGEVQTPLRGAAARNVRIGDHVWFRHAKAGEQAEFTESVVVVSQGAIVDHWKTYRGLGRSFV